MMDGDKNSSHKYGRKFSSHSGLRIQVFWDLTLCCRVSGPRLCEGR